MKGTFTYDSLLQYHDILFNRRRKLKALLPRDPKASDMKMITRVIEICDNISSRMRSVKLALNILSGLTPDRSEISDSRQRRATNESTGGVRPYLDKDDSFKRKFWTMYKDGTIEYKIKS